MVLLGVFQFLTNKEWGINMSKTSYKKRTVLKSFNLTLNEEKDGYIISGILSSLISPEARSEDLPYIEEEMFNLDLEDTKSVINANILDFYESTPENSSLISFLTSIGIFSKSHVSKERSIKIKIFPIDSRTGSLLDADVNLKVVEDVYSFKSNVNQYIPMCIRWSADVSVEGYKTTSISFMGNRSRSVDVLMDRA